MIRFKLAVALLLGSTVACAQNEKKLQADFLKPTLEYRMNVNRHSMPRDDREQDSMIQWIISNGYGGMATNVNPNEYLKSDEELKVFNRFVHASKARRRAVGIRPGAEPAVVDSRRSDPVDGSRRHVDNRPDFARAALHRIPGRHRPGRNDAALPESADARSDQTVHRTDAPALRAGFYRETRNPFHLHVYRRTVVDGSAVPEPRIRRLPVERKRIDRIHDPLQRRSERRAAADDAGSGAGRGETPLPVFPDHRGFHEPELFSSDTGILFHAKAQIGRTSARRRDDDGAGSAVRQHHGLLPRDGRTGHRRADRYAELYAPLPVLFAIGVVGRRTARQFDGHVRIVPDPGL